MDPWRKETLNLQVSDFIIWQDEAIEVEGQAALVTPGMKGKVLSLHDGFHMDVAQVESWRPVGAPETQGARVEPIRSVSYVPV